MLSHKNLLCNSAIIRRAFGNTSNSSAVFWLPLYHDMGLIGGVIQPIYCGGSCTLVSPAAFLQRPVLWLETISRTRATVSGGPDFAYDLCVRKVSAKERASLDLSRWKVAFVGAEPISQNPGTLCHRLRPLQVPPEIVSPMLRACRSGLWCREGHVQPHRPSFT